MVRGQQVILAHLLVMDFLDGNSLDNTKKREKTRVGAGGIET